MRRSILFFPLLVAQLPLGCGKEDTSSSASPTAADASRHIEEPTALPEYHGLYAIDSGNCIPLDDPEPPTVSPHVTFLLYDKAVATGLASLGGDAGLERRVPIRYSISIPFTAPLDAWATASPQDLQGTLRDTRSPIPLKTKSVDGKPEMLRLVPSQDLAPGLYNVRPYGKSVRVGPSQLPMHDSFLDGLRPTAALDQRLAEWRIAAKKACDGRLWEEAQPIIAALRALCPADEQVALLERTATVGRLLDEAAASKAQGQIGISYRKYREITQLVPNEPTATAAMAHCRPDAQKDPVAWVPLKEFPAADAEAVALADGRLIIARAGQLVSYGLRNQDDSRQSPLAERQQRSAFGFDVSGPFLCDGAIVYNLRTGSQTGAVQLEKINQVNVDACAVDSTGKLVALGCRDNTIRLCSPESGNVIAELKGHESWIKSVCFSSDGKLLVSGAYDYIYGHDASVRLWDVKERKLVKDLGKIVDLSDCPVTSVSFSPDGQFVAAGGSARTGGFYERGGTTGKLGLWAVSSGNAILATRVTSGISCVSFTADGKRLVALRKDGRVDVFDTIANGKLLASIDTKASCADVKAMLVLSATGRLGVVLANRGDGRFAIVLGLDQQTIELE